MGMILTFCFYVFCSVIHYWFWQSNLQGWKWFTYLTKSFCNNLMKKEVLDDLPEDTEVEEERITGCTISLNKASICDRVTYWLNMVREVLMWILIYFYFYSEFISGARMFAGACPCQEMVLSPGKARPHPRGERSYKPWVTRCFTSIMDNNFVVKVIVNLTRFKVLRIKF